ncbi:UPF0481 protein At3g47200-like isoform X2 [Prosopis cineraria]|nr:UPF0481 protein At3g47200-like isoform X2 [Prosopis cineraria]
MEDKVMIDIKKLIQDNRDGRLLPTCCIYRVPLTIRHLNEEAYTPKVISIGPFHHGDPRLQDMEEHKQIFFKAFTQRAKSSLDDLVGFVKRSAKQVCASYSENIKLSEEELVKMVLVDAGFIIEIFMRWKRFPYEFDNDAKLSQSWLLDTINKDLLLLENQLPFFVIEELFNLAFPLDHRDLPSFFDLSCQYFNYFNVQKLKPNNDVSINHFTDLLRQFYLPRTRPETDSFLEAANHVLLYSASKLQEAGIKLKASTSKCLLELKFSGHTLEIPKILVEDSTEKLFRNMIALEQCHYPRESYITDYAMVLDCLINTHKDVDVLVHRKIVTNYLGDTNDVAAMVNGLWKNVVHENFNSEYLDTCRRLNEFCEHWWQKKKMALRRDYCRTQWQFVVSIAGVMLLILSVVQTIFSILQVVKK